jgi:hypothetical protein
MNIALTTVLITAATVMLDAPANAKVIMWQCTFPIVANPNGLIRDQDFKMLFALDDITGKAALIGNNGVTNVTVIAGDRVITFLQQLPSGTIQTTAIDVEGHSVHSRHTMIGGSLVPSQSYGSCANK